MLHIGCHLTTSKGYRKMGETALSIGADTFAFFTRNPRGGNAKAIDEKDMEALRELLEEHHFSPLVAHAPYTYNLCSEKEETREFAERSMREDLERMEYLPGNYYNFHPGAHRNQGAEKGIVFISGALNRLLTDEMQTTVLLETMAGKGTEVGRSFEEISGIISRTEKKDKIGVCLDTCHIYDGGYDLVSDPEGVLEDFDRVIGLSYLKAVHINDSKNPFASHKDRHERIGEGTIGWKAFERLINLPALKGLPFILETPNELDGYAEEIRRLRELKR
ncbi:MAG: deoxyribonuclease IV [Lachnospiraceae bacterium]|nr:deoxyribonuclease IV [Lachnospiraceae bacterium]